MILNLKLDTKTLVKNLQNILLLMNPQINTIDMFRKRSKLQILCTEQIMGLKKMVTTECRKACAPKSTSNLVEEELFQFLGVSFL